MLFAENTVPFYTPEDLAHYFRTQHQQTRKIFLFGLLVLSLTILYEGVRWQQMGFSPLRTPVYVVVLPVMLFSFVYLPSKNYAIAKMCATQALVNLSTQQAVLTPLTGDTQSLMNCVLSEKEITFYGKQYRTKQLRGEAPDGQAHTFVVPLARA
jgi:hypothetical protein